MSKYDIIEAHQSPNSTTKSLGFLFLYVIAAYCLASLVSLVLCFALGYSFSEFENLTKAPFTKDKRVILLILQGITHLGAFTLVSIFHLKKIESKVFNDLNQASISVNKLILAIALWLFSLPLMEKVINWNRSINFGPFDKAFRETEKSTEELVKRLMEFTSFGDFLLSFLVVAVLAGLGEELLFRGIIQNRLYRKFKNEHVAIWVTGVLFSLIHFQMLGFFPRVLLGVIFGYMYFWGGNIWYSIICHTLNNGMIVVLYYLKNLGKISMENVEKMEVPLQATLLVTVLFGMIIYKNYQSRIPEEDYKTIL
jgi:uncharacterized protein